MPRWSISVPEVHRRTVVVDAETFDDACEAIREGEFFDSKEASYSSTIDPTDAEWIVLDQA